MRAVAGATRYATSDATPLATSGATLAPHISAGQQGCAQPHATPCNPASQPDATPPPSLGGGGCVAPLRTADEEIEKPARATAQHPVYLFFTAGMS